MAEKLPDYALDPYRKPEKKVVKKQSRAPSNVVDDIVKAKGLTRGKYSSAEHARFFQPKQSESVEEVKPEQKTLRQEFEETRTPHDWKATALMGATPLLMSLITGGISGAGIGGQGMIDEVDRQQKEDKDVMNWLRKRREGADGTSGKRRFGAYAYEKDDGTVGYASHDKFTGGFIDPATGEKIKESLVKAYAPKIVKDFQKDPKVFKGGSGTIGDLDGLSTPRGMLKPEEKADIQKIQATLRKDDTYKAYDKGIRSGERIIHHLQKGNPISDMGMGVPFARAFGDVGNIAAKEAEIWKGSSAWNIKAKSIWKKYTEGTLADEDRDSMIKVAQDIIEWSEGGLDELIARVREEGATSSNVTERRIKRSLRTFGRKSDYGRGGRKGKNIKFNKKKKDTKAEQTEAQKIMAGLKF